MREAEWQPWRALRARPHVELHFDEAVDGAGGGVLGTRGDQAAIVLSPNLGRRQRKATLTHELIHEERRITAPAASDATMEREEAEVRKETARRLVPLDRLEAFAAERTSIGPVMASDVADEFDVPEWVAWDAVRLLQASMLERELRRSVADHPSRAYRASDARPSTLGPARPRPEPSADND